MAINANVVARYECDICEAQGNSNIKEEAFDLDLDEDDASIPIGWIYKRLPTGWIYKRLMDLPMPLVEKGPNYRINVKVVVCRECVARYIV